jgi:hypothetical protein
MSIYFGDMACNFRNPLDMDADKISDKNSNPYGINKI